MKPVIFAEGIKNMSNKLRVAALAASLGVLTPAAPVRSCSTAVAWYADLTGAGETPAVSTAGKGRATFQFDFEHPVSTVIVSAEGLDNIQQIELAIAVPGASPRRTATILLCDTAKTPFSGSLTKTLTVADLPQTAQQPPLTMTDVANAVLCHQATVTIRTKAHPGGEIAGMIAMHKYAVYSADPKSAFHDPALHHTSQAEPPKP